MSIFAQIVEGLANLDEGYANRRAQEKRDDKLNKYQSERDERLNNLQLKRDQLLAAEQAVRDARLHGNQMDVQRAEIEATKARDEFRAAHEAKQAGEDRKFKSNEREESQKFQSVEGERERGWRTGERKGGQDFQAGESKKDRKLRKMLQSADQNFQRGEREGSQNWRSTESDRDRMERRDLADKEHQNRLDTLRAMTDEDLRKAKGLAADEERRRRDSVVRALPDSVPIEDRYNTFRSLEKKRLVDIPMAEAEGREAAIKDSGGYVLFPGGGSVLRGREGGGTGFPTQDDGRLGLTMDDLRRGAPVAPPQKPEPNQLGPNWLRSLVQ